MKKNTMLRIASVLLVAVMMTTCAISGTFAKYVTSGESTDTARVAKFGVVVTGYSDMFKKEYATDDTGYTGVLSVASSTNDKLVAPGTEGKLANFTVTGTPEVAVEVTYDVVNFELADWTTDGTDEYCPIIITVDGTDFYINGTTIKTVAELQTAVINAIEGHSQKYAPKTDLSTIASDGVEISWAWEFEGSTVSSQTDAKDTLLGNRAANSNPATITIEVTCTVTQID